jgi:hypothetical protein
MPGKKSINRRRQKLTEDVLGNFRMPAKITPELEKKIQELFGPRKMNMGGVVPGRGGSFKGTK